MRRCDVGDFAEFAKSDLFGLCGESLSLPIVESSSFSVNLLENADFLLEILNDGLLLAIDPTRQAQQDELQRIHGQRMPIWDVISIPNLRQ